MAANKAIEGARHRAEIPTALLARRVAFQMPTSSSHRGETADPWLHLAADASRRKP
jgi:hypothetical protein